METKTFRKFPKAVLQTMIPEEVIDEVSLRAIRDRKPENAIVTELLCAGLGLDPSKFGIEPGLPTPTPCAN